MNVSSSFAFSACSVIFHRFYSVLDDGKPIHSFRVILRLNLLIKHAQLHQKHPFRSPKTASPIYHIHIHVVPYTITIYPVPGSGSIIISSIGHNIYITITATIQWYRRISPLQLQSLVLIWFGFVSLHFHFHVIWSLFFGHESFDLETFPSRERSRKHDGTEKMKRWGVYAHAQPIAWLLFILLLYNIHQKTNETQATGSNSSQGSIIELEQQQQWQQEQLQQ